MASGESLTSPLDMSPSEEPSSKRSKYSFPVNSLETMQRSVMNAFALKYSKCDYNSSQCKVQNKDVKYIDNSDGVKYSLTSALAIDGCFL